MQNIAVKQTTRVILKKVYRDDSQESLMAKGVDPWTGLCEVGNEVEGYEVGERVYISEDLDGFETVIVDGDILLVGETEGIIRRWK